MVNFGSSNEKLELKSARKMPNTSAQEIVSPVLERIFLGLFRSGDLIKVPEVRDKLRASSQGRDVSYDNNCSDSKP